MLMNYHEWLIKKSTPIWPKMCTVEKMFFKLQTEWKIVEMQMNAPFDIIIYAPPERTNQRMKSFKLFKSIRANTNI